MKGTKCFIRTCDDLLAFDSAPLSTERGPSGSFVPNVPKDFDRSGSDAKLCDARVVPMPVSESIKQMNVHSDTGYTSVVIFSVGE